jgi:hypothetical protein
MLAEGAELAAVIDRFDLKPAGGDSHSARVEAVTASREATLPRILRELTSDRLKELCRAADVGDSGRNAPTLIRRLTKTEPATRLFGLVARDARIAVVFRRGPSKQVRMLLWDLATDEITAGQWLAGRIYDTRCGISPDGKLLVYFAGKFKTKLGTFTAVSRPPFFTALALWPDGSTYGGGGFFEENRKLILNYNAIPRVLSGGATLPDDFVVSPRDVRTRHHREEAADAQQGWMLKSKGSDGVPTREMRYVFSPPWVHEKPHPTRTGLTLERSTLGMFEVNGPSSVHGYRLCEAPRRGGSGTIAEELGRLDWADWDHDGTLLFAEDGCLYRRDLLAREARLKRVADLRNQAFVNLRPPDNAQVWPRNEGSEGPVGSRRGARSRNGMQTRRW